MALHIYGLSHTFLNDIQLNIVASCATELIDDFNSVLMMTNSAITTENAVIEKGALVQWLELLGSNEE